MVLGRIKHWTQLATDARYREIDRLLKLPRKIAGRTRLLGPELSFVDGRSCALQHLVIFERGIYAMRAARNDPRIIDAGANIGMATIFFKRLFPSCRIVAFEADPIIVEVLRRNIAAFGFNDVEVRHEAVSDRCGQMNFASDGADGGRLSTVETGTAVSVVRLRDWLNEPIDLLKLDVEGAESAIVFDCREQLQNVSRIFVEYHSFASERQILPEFLMALRGAGFRIFIQTDYCPPSPLLDVAIDGSMDLRLNVFGVRI